MPRWPSWSYGTGWFPICVGLEPRRRGIPPRLRPSQAHPPFRCLGSPDILGPSGKCPVYGVNLGVKNYLVGAYVVALANPPTRGPPGACRSHRFAVQSRAIGPDPRVHSVSVSPSLCHLQPQLSHNDLPSDAPVAFQRTCIIRPPLARWRHSEWSRDNVIQDNMVT